MSKAKKTTESFLHQAVRDVKFTSIIRKFGNDGYAMFYNLKEQLCINNNHYIVVSDEDDLLDVADYCNVEVKTLINFLDYVTKRLPNEYSNELWTLHKVIYSPALTEQLTESVYTKRVEKPITEQELKLKLTEEKKTELNESEQKLTEENLTEQNKSKLKLTEEKKTELNESKPNITKLKESYGMYPDRNGKLPTVTESNGQELKVTECTDNVSTTSLTSDEDALNYFTSNSTRTELIKKIIQLFEVTDKKDIIEVIKLSQPYCDILQSESKLNYLQPNVDYVYGNIKNNFKSITQVA